MSPSRLVLAAAAVATLLGARPVRAADDKTDGKKPGREPGTGIELGAFVHAATANPVLDYFYDKHQSVQPTVLGGYMMRRSPGGARLMIDVSYTTVKPKDGIWLGHGKTTADEEWTTFRDFKIYTADLVVGHEWGSGGIFGFFAGGGVGVALPSGSVTSYAGGTPLGAPDKKKIPPAVPVITFRAGPTFNFGNVATLMLEGGFDSGVYLGASFGLRL